MFYYHLFVNYLITYLIVSNKKNLTTKITRKVVRFIQLGRLSKTENYGCRFAQDPRFIYKHKSRFMEVNNIHICE